MLVLKGLLIALGSGLGLALALLAAPLVRAQPNEATRSWNQRLRRDGADHRSERAPTRLPARGREAHPGQPRAPPSPTGRN